MNPETEAWVAVAEIDFRSATWLLEPSNPIPEAACFHAQQCIEKYLKSVLEEAGQPVPRTHDLGALAIAFAPGLTQHQAAIEAIAPYSVGLRYPYDPTLFPDLDDEAEQAVDTMRIVRSVVRTTLRLPPSI